MEKQEKKQMKEEKKASSESKLSGDRNNSAKAVTCNDKQCPFHGNLKLRGRTFKGYVISKNQRRVAIEFERIIYIKKYERQAKKKTKK